MTQPKQAVITRAILMGAVALCAAAAPVMADMSTDVGFISWDVTFPGNAGQFDIVNLTGPNAFAPTFPITTPVSLTNLSLTVDFVGGGSTVYGPGSGYFSLAPDGESYNGSAIPIGGTNPQPVSATLTGTFAPLSVISNGSPLSIDPTFTVTFADSPNLVDGDFGIIAATTAVTTTTPEPGYWLVLAVGVGLLWLARRRKIGAPGTSGVVSCLLPVLCLVAVAHSAFAAGPPAVRLATDTSPSSGVSGVTDVNITVSGLPAGKVTAANVVVTIASSCDGAAVATADASTVKLIIGGVGRIGFGIPNGLKTGNYFVTVADSTPGDEEFVTAPGSCSEVAVTGSSAVLNACVAGSSMGVLLPKGGAGGNVTAYVPKGYWEGGATGVFVQNIEGTIAPTALVPTPNIPNSCSSNPATGQTVCVANNTDVYLISGSTLNTTLTSGSNQFAGFSGGSCKNCGVALNAANNTAAINMGLVGGTDGGIQILDLNTNTFGAPLPMVQRVSENISVDPTRSLILSAGETQNFSLLQIQPNGSLKEFDSTFFTGIENDASAEDCSTGIGLTPGEFTDDVFLVNLNNITFGASTYTAPTFLATLKTAYSFSAGLSGSAVAQGSGHLAVVTGEFGGNTFAVLQLPATASAGAPSLVDYAVAAIPTSAKCGFFSAGFDPHTITAYTSPNTGDSYAVFAGYSGGVPSCLAVVDMTTVINSALSPRGGGGYLAHDVSPANLPSSAITFFPL